MSYVILGFGGNHVPVDRFTISIKEFKVGGYIFSGDQVNRCLDIMQDGDGEITLTDVKDKERSFTYDDIKPMFTDVSNIKWYEDIDITNEKIKTWDDLLWSHTLGSFIIDGKKTEFQVSGTNCFKGIIISLICTDMIETKILPIDIINIAKTLYNRLVNEKRILPNLDLVMLNNCCEE